MVQRFIDTHAEVILGAFAAVSVLCAAALITAAHGLGKAQNAAAITTQPGGNAEAGTVPAAVPGPAEL